MYCFVPGSTCIVTPIQLPLSLSFPVLFLFKSEPSSLNFVYPLAIFQWCYCAANAPDNFISTLYAKTFEVNATEIKIIIKMYHFSVWYRNWHEQTHRHRHTNALIKQWDAVLLLLCYGMRKYEWNVIVYGDKCSK